MSEEKRMCIFGDKHGECQVLPKIIEMGNQAIQAMKVAYGDKSKDIANIMASAMSTPILNLSQYCQACPKIPKKVLVLVKDQVLVRDITRRKGGK